MYDKSEIVAVLLVHLLFVYIIKNLIGFALLGPRLLTDFAFCLSLVLLNFQVLIIKSVFEFEVLLLLIYNCSNKITGYQARWVDGKNCLQRESEC